MSDCSDYPTTETAKTFKLDAETTNEFVTSTNDLTSPASDGEEKITLTGLVSLTNDAIENTIGKSYIGAWSIGVTTFNFMNEYAEFNGITYKPKSGTSLPYTAQTASPLTSPDSENVEPFSDINSSNVGYISSYSAISVSDMADGLTPGGFAIQHEIGQKWKTSGYYTTGDGGGMDYEIVASGTGVVDGFEFIGLTSSPLQAKATFPGAKYNLLQGGVKNDGTLSDVQLLSVVSASQGRSIEVTPGEYNFSSFPSGMNSVSFFGNPDLIAWSDVPLPVEATILTDNKQTAIVAGVIRYYDAGVSGPGWYFLVDQGEQHNPILLGPVTSSGSASVVIDVNFDKLGINPLLWTPAGFVCGPDETLAQEGITVGASVGTDQVTIKAGITQNLPQEISYNGSSWVSPSIYTTTWETDRLRVVRDPDWRRDGASSGDNSIVIQMLHRSTGVQIAQPHILVVDDNTIDIFFYDFTGTQITSPSSNMRMDISDPYRRASSFNFNNINTNKNSNIWIVGAFVRKP